MPYHYIASFLVVALFFVAIPLSGAFAARASWRRFRRRMVQFSLAPLLDYGSLGAGSRAGPKRFFGELDAVEGELCIWLRGGGLSVRVDLERAELYYFPAGSMALEGRIERDRAVFPDEEPEHVTWKGITPLPEGSPAFVGGWLAGGEPPGTFAQGKDRPLVVIFYDGDRTNLLRRCIWSGRQRNELWNQMSPVAILAGIFAQILSIIFLWPRPLSVNDATLAILGVVLPILPFLPPGVALLALYRYFWRRARDYRGERDLLSMQDRYFARGVERARLPDGSLYARTCLDERRAAAALSEAKIRCPHDVDPFRVPLAAYRFYGVEDAELGIARPADPMVDFVAVPGDPEELSRIMGRKAKRDAALAGGFALLGAAANFALAYLWLSSSIS